MPGRRKRQGRRLTTAGLITLSAASLLMMAWAIFPTAAFADQTINVSTGSLSGHGCNATEWHFIINGLEDQNGNGSDDDEAPASIHVTWANGASATVPLGSTPGGTAHYTTTANLGSTVTGATAVIYDGFDGNFVLSHGPCGTTTTSTSTTSTSTTSTGTTSTGTTTAPGGSTTSTTETDTTTTDTDTVSPTTVTPTSTTPDQVSPTTVTPGGTAFTGIENVVPLGAIALFLATGGTGLLWAGARRRRDDSKDEE